MTRARDLEDALAALVRHYNRFVKHRCEIIEEAESVLQGNPLPRFDLSEDSSNVIPPEAGRKINALVAEKVMDWEPYSGGYYYGKNGQLLVCMEPGDGAAPYWSPSTDLIAAWQVVEHMNQTTPDEFELMAELGGYTACFVQGESCWAETAQLAICKAALAAVRESLE